jgi:hypothetical protein
LTSVPIRSVGNDFAYLVFDGLENPLGRFDPHCGRSADVQLNLATVDERKEVMPDQSQHGAAETKHQDRRDRDDQMPIHQRCQQPDIRFTQPLEATLETGMDSGEQPGRRSARPTLALTLGDHVKAGDLLAQLTAPELDHQISQAEATLGQTQATLRQNQASMKLAEVTNVHSLLKENQEWIAVIWAIRPGASFVQIELVVNS